MAATVGVTHDALDIFSGKSVKQPHVDYICNKWTHDPATGTH